MSASDRYPGTVLVTGGSGTLGPAVLRAFLEAGWSVRALSRTGRDPLGGTQNVELVQGDVRDEALVRESCRGIDVVVHMAALLHVTHGAAERAAEYRDVNVRGTEVVVGGARASGLSRVVLTSSICVYGSAREGVLDEDSDVQPDTPYAETKREAERIVLGGGERGQRPEGVVLRLAAVYGPGIKGNYERLARAIARGRFVAVGSGANRRTLVFEEDAARAIVLAATDPRAAGRIFNVTDGGFHAVAEINQAIAVACGKQPPTWAVPLPIAKAVVGALEIGSRALARRAPVSRATLEKYTEEMSVSGERIRRSLGFEPRFSLEEGWERTVLTMKAEGRL